MSDQWSATGIGKTQQQIQNVQTASSTEIELIDPKTQTVE
jgi:hypothetical protein